MPLALLCKLLSLGKNGAAVKQARGRTPQARSRRLRLDVEALEQRWVPSTLYVGAGQKYATIQAAVNAANSGDFIQIESGTFQGQVTISKSLTLQGNGASSTFLEAPTNLGAPTASNPDAVVNVTGAGVSVTLQQLAIEGASASGTSNLLYGLRVGGNAFTLFQNGAVTNIIDSTSSTFGVGIDIGNSVNSPDGTGSQVGSAYLQNISITNYQRAGVVVDNTGSSASVFNNTITASSSHRGSSQTGIEDSDGAVANIQNNTIAGNFNDSTGTGILVYSPGATGSGCNSTVANVINNKISGSDLGIYVYGAALHLSGQTVSAYVENNIVTGSTFDGIWFDTCANVTVVDNQTSYNGTQSDALNGGESAIGDGDGGIYMDSSKYMTLTNNQSQNDIGSGLELYQCTNNTLSSTLIQNDTGAGLTLFGSNNNVINGFQINAIANLTVDANLLNTGNNGAGFYLYQSSGNTLAGCSAQHNAGSGFVLELSSGNTLNSAFSQQDGGSGIYLSGSTSNTISQPTCTSDTGSGIYLDAKSTGNTVKSGSFQHNGTSGGNADAVDLSVGTGTAGTANTWTYDTGGTYITVSGKTIL